MIDIEDARLRWIQERSQFDDFAAVLMSVIEAAIRPLGLWHHVEFRTKELDSLLKKLMKGKHKYDSLPDKVGIRVLVRYRDDIDRVCAELLQFLHCGKVDLKIPAANVVGYQSTHIDWVRLEQSHPEASRFPVTRFWAELQIRTQAQHLWSEMSHDGFYKNDATIAALSEDVQRRVHLMAGQIEIADREFNRLQGERPVQEEAELFHFLEPLYYRLTARRPDSELSLQVLKLLLPLFSPNNLGEVEKQLQTFFDERLSFLTERYRQAQQEGDIAHSPLLFQPEAIVLYERLVADEINLRSAWNKGFPEALLESFANEMGRSFD